MNRTGDLMSRFWAKVAMPRDPDNCWEWTGALRNGYGAIGRGGRRDGIEYAHRLAWTATYGFVSEQREICHHCDNRKCVNINHLYEGTRSDNIRDAWKRTRKRAA